MAFTRFVRIGAVVRINQGPDAGKIAVIVNILSTGAVQIDGPTTDVKRQVIPISQIELTDSMVKLPVSPRTAALKKILEQEKTVEKFFATKYGKSILAQRRRASLTDLELHKVHMIRKTKH